MGTSKHCVVLHGGTSDFWERDSIYQREIEQMLRATVAEAGSRLSSGATALDVVQFAVSVLEDCPLFNAGKGAVLNEDGEHELEAAIADGSSGAYGAVACVRKIKNPINAARAVLDHGQHVFLAGSAADDFAQASGIEMVSNEYFTTTTRKRHWEKRNGKKQMPAEDLETVGVVALDLYGNLAAAGSTGGTTFKMKGRLGDTAVLGAGLYVSKNVAVVCGKGEDILRGCLASKVATLHDILPLNHAATRAIVQNAGTAPSPCAILAINSKGQISIQSSGRVFLTASYTTSNLKAAVMGTTIPLYPTHTFYEDADVSAGFTRFPITPGHAIITCKGTEDLMSLTSSKFLGVLNTARKLSSAMCLTMKVNRCGLVSDGSRVISLIPLHGLSKAWEPVVNEVEEYCQIFPGYLTSKNGPEMTDSFLEETHARIKSQTQITQPFNHYFDGDPSDQNIFARIIRGEVPQWRVWEDDTHVAFLTPFGNTPGFTVLVPRKHLQSDIFRLEDQDYTGIVKAAHVVAQYLKNTFKIQRCGVFFEGYEIDYAHVKLVPVHEEESSRMKSFSAIEGPAAFHNRYEGYLTSQFGPLTSDFNAVSEEANKIRGWLESKNDVIGPPKTWRNPDVHSLEAINSPWYKAIFDLQDTLFHSTIDFFNHQVGFKYAIVPSTTDSISSPMGLGSDSVPVSVSLHGEHTHLADSMQFILEYMLRMDECVRGAYYIGCSFRGEDHDQMHLNQFFHIECEIPGTLDDGISVAESYIATVTSCLLHRNRGIIEKIAGETSHITALLSHLESNEGRFPRITLDDALELPEMISSANTWSYVVEKDHSKGRALTRTGEKVLIKKFSGAVWLTEMDHLSVPFYQAFVPNSKTSKALCADLLLGQGETLGLGQRHVYAETVQQALRMHEVPEKSYEWYMGIRDGAKGGKAMETTGWGMGMERFLAWLLKHDDIRDFAIIPRLKNMKFAP